MLAKNAIGILKHAKNHRFALPASGFRGVQTAKPDGEDLDTTTHIHFKQSTRPHPLNIKNLSSRDAEIALADHTGRLQNRIWSKEELAEKMGTLYHHKPVTFMDHLMNKVMFGLYHTFNFVTGYKADNPTVKAIEWRLIVLESIAGLCFDAKRLSPLDHFHLIFFFSSTLQASLVLWLLDSVISALCAESSVTMAGLPPFSRRPRTSACTCCCASTRLRHRV